MFKRKVDEEGGYPKVKQREGCEKDAGSEQTYSTERASLARDSAFDSFHV